MQDAAAHPTDLIKTALEMRLSLLYSRQVFLINCHTDSTTHKNLEVKRHILGLIIYPPPMKVNKPNICVKKNDIDETGTKNG